MTIASRKLFSMAAQIARGVRKSESHLVTDGESSQTWDELKASHEQTLRDNPGARIEIPNDPEI